MGDDADILGEYAGWLLSDPRRWNAGPVHWKQKMTLARARRYLCGVGRIIEVNSMMGIEAYPKKTGRAT